MSDEDLRAEVVDWASALGEVAVAQNQDYIDLMAPGRSKGSGILQLLDELRLPRESLQLYTFGDSWNDLPMHAIADTSHSFHHSPAEVRAATDRVIGSVSEVLGEYM